MLLQMWFSIGPNDSLLRAGHYNDVIMGAIASQITSLTIVYSTVYSDAVQRKHQSSASLAFVRGIHRGSVNSLHKWPVTRKIIPFDDVIMIKPLPEPIITDPRPVPVAFIRGQLHRNFGREIFRMTTATTKLKYICLNNKTIVCTRDQYKLRIYSTLSHRNTSWHE